MTLEFRLKKKFQTGFEISAEGQIGFSKDRPVAAVLGPSGSGKTSFIRWIAGLIRSDSGSLRWEGEIWEDVSAGLSLSPRRRRIGFLSQGYALFPHLSVEKNIAFGLRRVPGGERSARVDELLSLFRLGDVRDRRPAALSGGEKQRVALARAVAPKPRLLLLDEPFSALDTGTREQLLPQLDSWLKSAAIPSILITHDPDEAARLGAQTFHFRGGVLLGSKPSAST